jgi:uncharacterized protein (TIGR03437 family)
MIFRSAAAMMVAAASVLLPPNVEGQTATYTYTYNGVALPIFRDSADIISIAYVFVPKAIRITKVTANVEIDYPRPGDLNVFLYSPVLTRTRLLERDCGSQGSVSNVTFDDAAPTQYKDVCPAAPGSYRGDEPLSNFNDQIALGTWSLAVENNGSNDFIGFLRGVTLSITGTVITGKPITSADAVFNAASLQAGAVAPGEMVNIQGVNLGPSPAVQAPAGDLPASLGGVQVTFDGAPAAISYASSAVLTVQVPYGVQPGKQTDMRVIFQNASSDSVLLNVLNVTPGVYTQSAIGRGPVTAVNPDGSLNSLLHPAPKGQFVIIYAAGLGMVTPALNTGKAPPSSPLSNTVFPVTAEVDGIGANVSFAGAAPGFPGLYQVNLQIPQSARSGERSLVIHSEGAFSQFGVTIFVQ